MSTAHTVLDRLLEPLSACLTVEVADRVAKRSRTRSCSGTYRGSRPEIR